MKKQPTERQKRINLICNILMVVFFLISVFSLFYPLIFNTLHEQEQTRTIVSYDNRAAQMDPARKAALLEEAEEYNARLRLKPLRLKQTEAKMEDYLSRFNPSDDGVIGHITIPCINVELMVYHTVEEPVLQVGVGHLPGTSFPIGGIGTHAVLSGHRGLTTAALFTDLDKLEIGDKFYLTVLQDVLTYEVDQIKTVLPHELDDIVIDPAQDYVTLITCTPYGINSHRLLVRGHRVETPRAQTPDEGEVGSYVIERPAEVKSGLPMDMEKYMAAAGVLVLLAAAGGGVYTLHARRKKRPAAAPPAEEAEEAQDGSAEDALAEADRTAAQQALPETDQTRTKEAGDNDGEPESRE